MRLITAEIRKYKPQVVCLQEVFEPVLTQKLIKEIGFGHAFANLAAGLLILSHDRMEDKKEVKYQHQSTLENNDRRFILTEIHANGKKCWIGNTHLSWKAADETARTMQTRELAATLDALKAPVLVMGDFNCTPESEAMAVLSKSGFTNVYDRLYPGKNVFTWDNQRNPYLKTHAAILPNRRIDHLYMNQAFQEVFKPQSCRLIFTTPDEAGDFPSDHFGWLATFRTWGQVPDLTPSL